MEKYKCPCCGFYTLDERGAYDICPVCFWEDEGYFYKIEDGAGTLSEEMDTEDGMYDDEETLDRRSGANHGLTLRQGRENYKKFGACEEDMVSHVRKPYASEMEISETEADETEAAPFAGSTRKKEK